MQFPVSPQEDARVTAPSLDDRRPASYSSCLGLKDGLERMVRLNRCRRRRLIIRTDCRVARVGPTTPKQVGQSEVASVDPTEVGHVGVDDTRVF